MHLRPAALAAHALLACGATEPEPAPAADAASPPDAAPIADAPGADGPADVAAADRPAADAALAPGECLSALVRLGDFEIFAYEASRPDATDGDAGADETLACSRPGVLPWGDLDLAAAREACAASGFALCTGEQWLLACGGPVHRAFPYGPDHQDAVCNDHVSGSAAVEAGGARAGCQTPEGVFDLSGNLAEMADDATKRGGSFRVNAVQYQVEHARCDAQFRVFEGVVSDDVGFRCCRPSP